MVVPVLDFIVTGFPRSATTWASVWLNTQITHCVHDPLHHWHYTDFDQVLGSELFTTGISCTGVWHWVDWLNAHPAKKLVLHRGFSDVQNSLVAAGFPQMPESDRHGLDNVQGLHVHYADLFNKHTAEHIWNYLVPEPFDAKRHKELVASRIITRHDPKLLTTPLYKRLCDEVRAMHQG